MSDCPVCGKAGVDEDATRCPQCHSDLECFTLLDTLHEAAPAAQADLQEVRRAIDNLRNDLSRDAAGRGRRYDWPVPTAIGALAALIVVVQLVVVDRRSAEPPGSASVAAVEAIGGGVERLAGRLGGIEGRLDALAGELARISVATASVAREAATEKAATPAEKPPELILHHHLRRSETLWSVAKRYYGQGHLYPVLFAHNPGLGPYHRGARTLRIPADLDEAEKLYRRITPPGGEGRLFRYRVEPGDDWHKLAERFLGRPGRAPELVALNPKSDLKPGEQILIVLE